MQEQPSFSSFPQPNGTPDFSPESEQQPTQPTTPSPPPIPEPPRKSKGPLITIILLSLLLLGALGFIAYMNVMKPEKTDDNNTPTVVEQPNEATNDAATVIAKVKVALNDKLAPTYATLQVKDGTEAPSYKPANEVFAIAGDAIQGKSLTATPMPNITNEVAIKATQAAIDESLTEMSRFTMKSGAIYKTYQDNSVVCATFVADSYVDLRCADISDYSGAITETKPLAAAFLQSDQGKTMSKESTVGFGHIKTTKQTGGYSNAAVPIAGTDAVVGGFSGLFYAKDGNWSYFTGTQQVLSCAMYNTYDIQASFAGDPCYVGGTNEQSVVKITLTKS